VLVLFSYTCLCLHHVFKEGTQLQFKKFVLRRYFALKQKGYCLRRFFVGLGVGVGEGVNLLEIYFCNLDSFVIWGGGER